MDNELIAPSSELDRSALHFAERIGQSKAYDAQYLALAARENAAWPAPPKPPAWPGYTGSAN